HHPNLHSFPTRRSSDLVSTSANNDTTPAPADALRKATCPGLERLAKNCFQMLPQLAGNRTAPSRKSRKVACSHVAPCSYAKMAVDRKSTRLNSSHDQIS